MQYIAHYKIGEYWYTEEMNERKAEYNFKKMCVDLPHSDFYFTAYSLGAHIRGPQPRAKEYHELYHPERMTREDILQLGALEAN